jgi:hypothetical protein
LSAAFFSGRVRATNSAFDPLVEIAFSKTATASATVFKKSDRRDLLPLFPEFSENLIAFKLWG